MASPTHAPAAASSLIARRLSRLRVAYIGGFVALVALGVALGDRGQTLVAVGAGALAITAVLYGVATLRPPRAGAWLMLAIGIGFATAGEICLGFAAPIGAAYPSVADILFTVAYLPLAVALLWIGHSPSGRPQWPAALDAAVLTLTGSLVAWFLLYRPTLRNVDLDGLARTFAIMDWTGDVAIAAVAILMVFTWRANRAVHLLGVAIAALLVADVINGAMLARGEVERGAGIDLAFALFGLFAGLAAMHPAMVRVTSPLEQPERLGVVRLALLAIALLAPPSLLLAEATRGPVDVLDAIAIISATIALLLLARIAHALWTLREQANRERALNMAGSALSAATTPEQVRRHLREAVAALAPSGTPSATLHPPDSLLQATTVGLVDRGRRARLRVPVSPTTDGRHTVGEIRIEGPARRVIGLIGPLTTVADQAGAALARINLSDAVRDHERERYFRTLVRNSSDVILISRDGVVEFATPSARELFGDRAVVGERLDRLVQITAGSAAEGAVRVGAETKVVRVSQRDLSSEPTVRGVVVTLQDITAQRRLETELTHRATHDPLTGLANGELLRDELRKAAHAARPDRCCAVLFVDLDNFKEVNDSLGHSAGDKLLKATAERLEACLRRDQDLAARLGGDEFALLLRDLHDLAAAREIASRVVNAFRRPIVVAEMAVNCTVSVGLASAFDPDEYDSLLRRADVAVYATKAAGRNGWSEHHGGGPSHIRRREPVEPPIELHYQPIVDLATGGAVGFEALARLQGPERQSTSPADYIAEAENDGLIVAIGDWVIEEALRDAPALTAAGARYVSVNVSPVQLRQRGFAERVLERLDASTVTPAELMVELTERLQLDPASAAWDELDLLHEAGVRVALDDYGTGYATLSYLRHPCVDVIKLDRSFLKDIRRPRPARLLSAAVSVASSLGLQLIVEGVESASLRDAALAAGCTQGQGLFFAPALPQNVAAAWKGVRA